MADNFNEELNNELGEMAEGEVNENLIELTDEETGESVLFEHLDTIFVDGVEYYALTEYIEEPTEEDDESDIYLMQPLVGDDGEEILEIVDDDDVLEKAFAIFRENHGEEFDFIG